MKKNVFVKACLILLVAVSSLALFPSPVRAFSNTLTVDPNPASAPEGSTITIGVVVNDFEPINGFDISVRYDGVPGVLRAVSVDLADSIFLVTSYPPHVLVSCVNAQPSSCPSGTVRVAATILGGHTSASNGPLFNIHLEVIGPGETALDIFDDQIANPNLTPHATIDGSFSSGPPVPEPDFYLNAPPV